MDHELKMIRLIQKEYKLYRIKRQLKKVRSYDLSKIGGMSYDAVMKYVMNRELMLEVNRFLYRITRYVEPDKKAIPKNLCRLLISAYIVLYHTKDVLTNIEELSKLPLLLCAMKIVRQIDRLMFENRSKYSSEYYLLRFCGLLNEYSVQYDLLREMDKRCLLNTLMIELVNIRTTKRHIERGTKYLEIQKKEIIKQLTVEEKKYREDIRLLEPKITDDKIDNLTDIGLRLKTQYNEATWNIFIEKMREKDYTMLFDFLEDLKILIIDLTTEKDRIKKRESLDQAIDIELIGHMISNNAMSVYDIKQLCDTIYMIIVEMQSPIRDNDSNDQYTELLMKMDDLDDATFIAYFLRMIFQMIDDIYCDIILLDMYKKGTLK